MFYSSVLDELRSSKVSRLNGMVKTVETKRDGQTIEISSSAIVIKDASAGVLEMTVLDRPPGYPHKSGGGVTFFIEPSDNNHQRAARDVLFWLSLHSTGFRDKIDPRAVVDAYKHMDEPTLRCEHCRTERRQVVHV